MKGKKILCALMATALLALFFAIPTSADSPDIQKGYVNMTWTWEDNPCGFVIEEQYIGVLKEQIFYDKDGNQVRYQGPAAPYTFTWSHDGNTLEVLISGLYREDIISETEKEVHILETNQLITVPGYGLVHGMAGHLGFRTELIKREWVITEEFKLAGVTWLEEWGPICEYLDS